MGSVVGAYNKRDPLGTDNDAEEEEEEEDE